MKRSWNGCGTQYGSRICALITEPYLGGGGSFHPQKEYIQLLERFCREHDIVFILDEVQANFGRTGALFAFTEYGVEPDIVVLGKGLGNGVAVSAAVGRADLFANMHYGEGSDTWSANPLASAAVLATLDEYEATDVIEKGRRAIEGDRAGAAQAGRAAGESRTCAGKAWCGAWSARRWASKSAEEVALACVEACYLGDEQGRAIHLLGPLAGKVIRVSPPLGDAVRGGGGVFGSDVSIFSKVFGSESKRPVPKP